MKPIFCSLLLLFAFLGRLLAQADHYKNEAGFQTDNDGFLGTESDRYYTAGNFFYFNHALAIAPDSTALQNKILGFELGQKIYTPFTGNVTDPRYIDRPFAGYLYIATSVNWLFKNESNIKFNAQVGFVGPDSYAQQTQDLIHKVFDFYTPGGWQYQVHNDFEINLALNYNQLIARFDIIDFSANTYANLGNGFTGAGAGFTIRAGLFNQLFNSSSTQSTTSFKAQKKALTKTELFFYYNPLINLVAYNSTVQGGLFSQPRGSYQVLRTVNPLIFSQQFGGSFVKNHWVLGISAIFETREVKEMFRQGHQWGSINVLYRFN